MFEKNKAGYQGPLKLKKWFGGGSGAHHLVQKAVFWYILGTKPHELNKLLVGEKICLMQLMRLS